MRALVAVGSRPDVIRVAPLLPAAARASVDLDIVLSGAPASAYLTDKVSTLFGVELPEPHAVIGKSGEAASVGVGPALVGFEELFSGEVADAVVVIGDSNAAVAAALAAARKAIPVVHLDAGLRCGDLSMPDEVNRIVVSRIAALHLTPTERALEVLEDEGVEPERIQFVGSIAAECALRALDDVSGVEVYPRFAVQKGEYVVAAIRRRENLGSALKLSGIADGLERFPLPVVLPDAEAFTAAATRHGVQVGRSLVSAAALPYREMLSLVRDAAAVVTDCGSLAEEACCAEVPCVTVRYCTEYDETIAAGANRLARPERDAVCAALLDATGRRGHWVLPKRWDRAVSDRAVRALRRGVTPLA